METPSNMEKTTADILFEASQTLLGIASMLKANKNVDFGIGYEDLRKQAQEISDEWRKLLKNQ